MQPLPPARTRTVFDAITDFLATQPSAEEILAYFLPEDLQERADYLAEQNGEDLLTPDERKELDEFLKADQVFSLLKLKVNQKLRMQQLQRQQCRCARPVNARGDQTL
jgi:hypothetical protein